MSGLLRLRLLVVSLFLFVFTAVPLAAQGIISGTVVDARNDLAVTGVVVRLEPLNREATTDRTGRFVFTGVPAGSHVATTRYMGYTQASQTVQVATGQHSSIKVAITPSLNVLGDVIVTTTRVGQAAALNQQQSAPNVTNVIAADQIGRFPDANIGDALKRIPGVTVGLDQGEARFGSIRGTEPRFNTVMVNGERVPSAEAEIREVQLDLIPADMVQAIEVSKTLTPDMDADAIGGAVNVVTRAAPVGLRFSSTVGSGYNFIRDKPVLVGSLVAGNRFLENRLGVIVSASYYDQKFGSDNKEGEWNMTDDGRPFMQEFDVRRYDVQRTRRSLSGAVDLRLNDNHGLMLRSLYNHRDDWENRFRVRYVLGEPDAAGIQAAAIRRQTKGGGPGDRVREARLEDQRTQSHQLSGTHLFGGFASLAWSGSIARATESRPDERYIEWQSSNVNIRPDYSDEQNPMFSAVNPANVEASSFRFRRIEILDGFTKDSDRNGRIDLLLPFREGRSSIKIGARVRDKDKLRTNSFDRAVPLNASSFTNLAAGGPRDFTTNKNLAGNYPYGTFSTPGFLAGLPVQDRTQFRFSDQPSEYAAGNFDATERILAGYGQIEQRLSPAVSVIAGVRLENTDIDYDGFEYDLDTDDIRPTTGEKSYLDVLPGVNLRWDAGPRTVVRAAFTNTLARPNYFDLVPYREISLDDNELSTGNPDLKTTRSTNFDLMAERYFTSVGLISVGLFHKNVTDFIYSFTQFNEVDPVTNQTFSQISKPVNGAKATLSGVELAVQRQLDMLPGALRHLGVYANYTFNESGVSGLDIPGRDVEDLPLLGTARHSGNFSLSFDPPRANLRLALNYQSESLDAGEGGYNEEAFFDRWADRRLDVDMNASVQLMSNARFFLEANNLTNRPLRFYQGVRGRLMQDEFYGRRIQTGVKFDF